ncbi:hypothetical protein OOK31_29680 [Streptomyces sp. NBC_00249]|nr:hypothetical protein [Streptomyces sp. NBC_00249]MCX5198015.1 hypothetical protein [Streptomyces sp. NBC_00249]
MFCTLCGDDNGEKTGFDHEIDNCIWRGVSEEEITLMLGLPHPADRPGT